MTSFTAAPFPGAFGPGFGPGRFLPFGPDAPAGRRDRRRRARVDDPVWHRGAAAMTDAAMTDAAMTDEAGDAMTGDDAGAAPRRRRGGHRHGHDRGFGPGGPFGPGFGPGGPFGPPFGRGRGRARRGDVRAALLSLLAEQPRHGYDLIQEIAERTDGRWRPSAGAVYPALAQLEDEGLVRAQDEEGRKVFHLTEAGRAYVADHAAELAAPWAAATAGVPDSTVQTFELARQVATALQEVVRTGTPAQVTRAQALLTETRRGLYRILADDDEQPTTT